jgi:hypothetical protein
MTPRWTYFLLTVLLLITLSFSFERQAYAYVDPGSSLLVFQGVSAVVSGALIYFRRRICSLFSKTPESKAEPLPTKPS